MDRQINESVRDGDDLVQCESPIFYVRELELGDGESCWQIWSNILKNYPFPTGGTWSLAQIQYELQTHRGVGVFKNSCDLELIGFCLCRDTLQDQKEIMLLATQLDAQRIGAMSALLGVVLAEVSNSHQIWLEAHEQNTPAIKFYQRVGFRVVGHRRCYYQDGAGALVFQYKPLQ